MSWGWCIVHDGFLLLVYGLREKSYSIPAVQPQMTQHLKQLISGDSTVLLHVTLNSSTSLNL